MFLVSKNIGCTVLIENREWTKLCRWRKLHKSNFDGDRCIKYKPVLLQGPIFHSSLHQPSNYHTSTLYMFSKNSWGHKENHHEDWSHFNTRYLNAMLRRQSAWTKAVLTTVVFLFGSTGLYLYFFPEEVTDAVADTVSHLASKSLEDDRMITSAQLQTKVLIHNILNDEQMQKETVQFVKRVLQNDETKTTVRNLLIGVVQNEDFYNVVAAKLQNITTDIVKSEYMREIVKQQLHAIFQDPSTQQVLEKLLEDVIKQDEVKNVTCEFLNQVLASDKVCDKSAELGLNVAEKVLADGVVQKKAGDALWSALKYSFSPGNMWQPSLNNDNAEPKPKKKKDSSNWVPDPDTSFITPEPNDILS